MIGIKKNLQFIILKKEILLFAKKRRCKKSYFRKNILDIGQKNIKNVKLIQSLFKIYKNKQKLRTKRLII
jgi:hypothetical protein